MKATPRSRNDPFEALADATRRGILDLLRREDVLTAGEIAAAFPRISRPAVSRHLRVLRGADLVIAEESGREWRYRLNVAAVARLHRDWFAPFMPLWEQSLSRLKEEVEGSAQQAKRGA
ncbi:MAG TPA: metalloregulator ArsR/SmtB family transcription factor [Dehalococcoidia bacterium]